jgi:uncharacterized protein (DUF849 family)
LKTSYERLGGVRCGERVHSKMRGDEMTNQDEKEKLTPAQIQAVNKLAVGESITGAAEQLGLARQTISKWLNQDEEFQIALREKQTENFDDEVRRIKSKTARAIEVLSDALENPNLRIRLTAASKLLSIVGIQTSIAESEKPAQILIPPAIISQNCATCAVKIEARYFEELANL